MVKKYLPLIVIILFAVAIRLYQFGNLPHGLNRDEASIGYTAYSLLLTGKEEHGQSWPLKFESFGDWKQPVYIYLLIPLIKFFGLSESIVRLPSLLAGLILIITTFFLTQKTSGSATAGYVASLLLALNPWHFHFSHIGLEAMVATVLVATGILLIMSKKSPMIATGVFLLILSLYTYHAAIVFVPFSYLLLLLFNRNKLIHSKTFLSASLIFGLILVNIGYQGLFTREKDKITGTTIFSMNSQEQWTEIYQYRNESLSSKLIHNQYVYYIFRFAKNYMQAFSPTFLLTTGGLHQHYNVPGFGNFYLIEIVLFVAGAIWVVTQKHRPGLLILFILLLGPIPGAITKDGVHSTRNIFMLPYLQVLAGVGFIQTLSLFKLKLIKSFLMVSATIMLTIPAYKFLNYYYVSYPEISDSFFAGYMKPVSLYLAQNINNNQTIYITFPFESPYIHYAFYSKLDPQFLQREIEYYPVDTYGFRHVSRLGNLYFVPGVKDLDNLRLTKALILARTEETVNLQPVDSWKSLNGKSQITVYTENVSATK